MKSRAVSVTDTATRLDTTTEQWGSSLVFYNNGTATIYIGGADVTTANGAPVPSASWSPGFELGNLDALYGIVASGTHEARVLEQGL